MDMIEVKHFVSVDIDISKMVYKLMSAEKKGFELRKYFKDYNAYDIWITYNNEEDGCVFRLSISDFAEEGVCMTLCQREGTKINPSVMVNFLSEIIQKEKERKQRNAKTDKRSTKSETGGRN